MCFINIYRMFYLKNILTINEIDDKQSLVTVVTRRKVLLFENGVNWDSKNALKWFDFTLKFDISLLLIKMKGINGIFSIIESFQYRPV